MLLYGIINELEKDSGVLSCFFCQATSINSAAAVLRGLIYILVDRHRLFSCIKQPFEDINAWIAIRDIFMDILRDPGLQHLDLVVDALDECQR